MSRTCRRDCRSIGGLADLLTDEEREAFAAELIDRFGPLPDETKQLLEITAVKILCKRLGVAKVSAGPKGALLAFRPNAPLDTGKLVAYVQKRAKCAEAAARHEAGRGRERGRMRQVG